MHWSLRYRNYRLLAYHYRTFLHLGGGHAIRPNVVAARKDDNPWNPRFLSSLTTPPRPTAGSNAAAKTGGGGPRRAAMPRLPNERQTLHFAGAKPSMTEL